MEKKKLSTGIVVLITVLIVAVITLSIILIYKMGTGSNQIEKNEEKPQSNTTSSTNQTTNNTITENENKTNTVINARSSEVKVSYTFAKEENTDYNKGKRNFNVTINGIKCNDIESKNIQIEKDEKESDLKVYELKYIKDVTHSNEYILLGLYGYLPTSKSITYYVIDTSAQIIGKFECTNATEFILDDKTLEMEINEDNVIDYKFDRKSGNVAKHKYTVQNSKVIDTIIEVYDKSRVVRAGASV